MPEQETIKRLSTGIVGLDEVFHGGLLPYRSYLVRGAAGTGKTTLGLHFLTADAANDEKSLLITLGTPEARIRLDAKTFGFDLTSVPIIDLTPAPAWRRSGNEIAGHPPLRGWLAAPFVARDGRNLGLIQVSDKVDGSDFSAADEAILVQLAYVASVAIENARLVDGLREADRRKDEFLATLSHELRNPLAPIRNALQIMRLSDTDVAAVAQARTMMERQLTQMVRLVDDLLDVSRITRGKIELHKEQVELAAVVASAVETSRPLIEAASHEFRVILPPESILLDADLTRLAQVFSNLLNNASQYMEQRGHIWLTAERAGGEVMVKVRDTGLGIPADMLPKVFEIFTQVDRSLERSHGGLGIGLTLVKQLVEMHGGSVEAHSDGPGKGSEFIVRLPLWKDEGGRLKVESGTDPPDSSLLPHSSSLKVLVVDDNKDAASSLAMMLKIMGNEVRTAHDGLEGVETAAAFRPDMILMDIGMPKLNGYDACRRIREQPWAKNVVLVALTGWGQEEDRRRSSEAGFNVHLVKPVDLDALRKLLASREAPGLLRGNGP